VEKFYVPAAEVPLSDTYDVIIVGGGTSGAAAGISAAREGLKTLIIEQYGSLGGTQTMGLVTPMMSAYIENNSGHCSISKEINGRMLEAGKAAYNGSFFFDPTYLKFVLENMSVESGCDLMYHTMLADAAVSGGNIEYITVHNKSGLSAYKAARYVDCTGDADLAYKAGVPCGSGNDGGTNQAVSLRFEMANVNLDALSEYLKTNGQTEQTEYPMLHSDGFGCCPALRALTLEKRREGLLTQSDIAHFQFTTIPGKPSQISFNCPELGVGKNVNSAEFVSKKQIEGKKAINRIANFAKSFIPGFENAYVCEIAPMLGIRESRRIHAERVLTYKDVAERRKFDDGICVSNYPVDVHGVESDVVNGAFDAAFREYWEIPFRSLIPLTIDNLLAAGRCAGFDFAAQSAARVQHSCRAMGEAAGIACGLSIDQNAPFRKMDYSKLKKILFSRSENV
jgi:hypothetical protein